MGVFWNTSFYSHNIYFDIAPQIYDEGLTMTRFEQELAEMVKVNLIYDDHIKKHYLKVIQNNYEAGAAFAQEFYEPLLREAMEALEFYADETKHTTIKEGPDNGTMVMIGIISADTGSAARTTLASIREKLG